MRRAAPVWQWLIRQARRCGCHSRAGVAYVIACLFFLPGQTEGSPAAIEHRSQRTDKKSHDECELPAETEAESHESSRAGARFLLSGCVLFMVFVAGVVMDFVLIFLLVGSGIVLVAVVMSAAQVFKVGDHAHENHTRHQRSEK
jgi:hypothetical protein